MLTIAHTAEDGTLAEGTERGDGSAPILKAHGFRWGRNLGAWYVPRSRDQLANRWRIERAAEALKAGGFEVTVSIADEVTNPAEREARRDERAERRAEGLQAKAERKAQEANAAYERSRAATAGIPFGQPILVGHHSERRHRAALKRSDQAMARMSEAVAEERDALERAKGTAAAARQRRTPDYIGNRIAEGEARERKIDRILAGTDSALSGPAQGSYRERLDLELAQLRADLAYWRGELAALEDSGVKLWTRADFKKGDRVKVNGSWGIVERANPKTLAVNTGHMPWAIKYRYTEVSEKAEAPAEDVSAEDAPTQDGVTAGFVEWEDSPGLVGRKFEAPDGIATVTDERTPGGLYIILRGDGSRQGMRPAFVVAALERSEVEPAPTSGEDDDSEPGQLALS